MLFRPLVSAPAPYEGQIRIAQAHLAYRSSHAPVEALLCRSSRKCVLSPELRRAQSVNRGARTTEPTFGIHGLQNVF